MMSLGKRFTAQLEATIRVNVIREYQRRWVARTAILAAEAKKIQATLANVNLLRHAIYRMKNSDFFFEGNIFVRDDIAL